MQLQKFSDELFLRAALLFDIVKESDSCCFVKSMAQVSRVHVDRFCYCIESNWFFQMIFYVGLTGKNYPLLVAGISVLEKLVDL